MKAACRMALTVDAVALLEASMLGARGERDAFLDACKAADYTTCEVQDVRS